MPTQLESDLDAVVRGYVPNGDERSHQLALDVLGSGRPMWPRSEFAPGHFTASGFVISPDRESLLLIHHGKLDRWLQPGGHIESEDTSVEVAARREVLEETGMSGLLRVGPALLRIDAHEIPRWEREPAHVHIDLGIGFHTLNPEIGPLDEVLDAKWVGFSELARYDVDDALEAGANAVRHAVG